jgi:tryptophanyl-tRNA synthetase
MIIDPWGSQLVKNYERLIKDFGLEPFPPFLEKFPNPNSLMKRGIIFAGQGLNTILKAINSRKPFYVLSGIMPSNERLHFGNKSVVEMVKYFQELGAKTFMLVADLECAITRNISLQEARNRALNFHIPAFIALGLNPKKTFFYFQSENQQVKNLAILFSQKITLNEFKAIYGNTHPSRIVSALMQAGDILFPQLIEKMPGIIPVGIDQAPHIRLTRDIVRRTKNSFNFFLPSAIFFKYLPSLDGSFKMSKSLPQFNLSIPEPLNDVKRKILNTLTGGRETAEIQRRLGGQPEKCVKFELDKQHLMNEKELENIFVECKAGKRLCGECKQLTIKKLQEFLKDFEKRFEKARKQVHKLKFIKN